MTKDNFDRKKNYSNTKIIQLDPLAERLNSIGLKGGAGRSLLSRGVKKTTKDTIKNFKKTDKLSKQKDKLNDSGKFVKDGALANKNIKLKKEWQEEINGKSKI